MASQSISTMRAAITAVYPGNKWRMRVDRMSDNQVIAIFHSFSRNGLFEHPKTGKKEEDPNFRQMSLFDDFGVKKVYPYPKRMKGVVKND